MVKVQDVLRQAGGDLAAGSLDGFLLEALIHETTLAIGVVDASGTVSLLSPGLLEAAGVDYAPVPAEVIPAHFNVRTADGERLLRPEEEPLNRARAGESFRDLKVSVLQEDGSSVVLRCSGAPLRGADGEPEGGIVLFDDITAEWLATREQDLLRERLLETFNHELRTPLTTLIGHAEVLSDLAEDAALDLPPQAVRSLTALAQAGDRLRDLADTVSALGDLDTARRAHRSAVDLGALTSDVVRRRRAATEREVSVVLSGPRVLVADLDGPLVERALGALLDNAVAHAPHGTAVEVSLGSDGSEVWLAVTDHGPGIPLRQRERLVRPFERGDVGLTSPSGRGLGLAVVRAVASAHHGSLRLEDGAPSGLRAVLTLRS